MTADPDPFAEFRSGRLGHVPAFAPSSDPARLLSSVAEALNACERAGIIVDLDHGAVVTTRGYVLPAGDSRLGSRWAVRMRVPSGSMQDDDRSDED